ncbi:MAG: family lipase [Flavisolibacter sp.]|jgi:lysophospholipase L1-like esterase|nr:family lipase [Flavisolibacter sp.]
MIGLGMINRKILLMLLLITNGNFLLAQKKIDSSYNNTYYQGRMDLFASLGGQKKAIVFLGNSITERGVWSELLPGEIIMNRGIGGDNTFGVLARLNDVIQYKPKKIFLLIGINDIGRGLPVDVISNNYRRIIEQVRTGSPKTKLFVQSVLPLNEKILKAEYLKGKRDSIIKLNTAIQAMAKEAKITYIDLHPVFEDAPEILKENLTIDGIHLKPSAYVVWVNYLKKKNFL